MINNDWQALGVGLMNSENRRQQYRENRSAQVATIGALMSYGLIIRPVVASCFKVYSEEC